MPATLTDHAASSFKVAAAALSPFLPVTLSAPHSLPPPALQQVNDSTLSVNGKEITVVSSRDPTKLPWGELGVDLVIEGTGVFINSEGAGKHLQVGSNIPA